MLSIRSGEGQDIPPVVCAHIANQRNQAPSPPLNPTMDLVTQQFLVTRMQLIQNLSATNQTFKLSEVSHHQQHHQHQWTSIRNS
jgi:hypothetical protein